MKRLTFPRPVLNASVAGAWPALAQHYLSKPVRMIIGFPPGGGAAGQIGAESVDNSPE